MTELEFCALRDGKMSDNGASMNILTIMKLLYKYNKSLRMFWLYNISKKLLKFKNFKLLRFILFFLNQ